MISKENYKKAKEYATKHGYDRCIYETEWNGYYVYSPAMSDWNRNSYGGYPQYILVHDNEPTRTASFEEIESILDSL